MVGTIWYVPAALPGFATVVYVTVMLSPLLRPVIVPVNVGFGSP